MKRYFLIFAILTTLPTIVMAKECLYSVENGQTKLSWTAFKTPKKVGVSASFKSFELKTTPAKSWMELVKKAEFTIDTATVDSGNPERDKKIAHHFFKADTKNKVQLNGKVLKVTEGSLEMELTFNGVKRVVTMSIEKKLNEISLKGTIDVLDFNLSSSLQAINQACKVLHEGKTWSDVILELKTTLIEKC